MCSCIILLSHIGENYARLPDQLFTMGRFNSIPNLELNPCLETTLSMSKLPDKFNQSKSILTNLKLAIVNDGFINYPIIPVLSHLQTDLTRFVFSVPVNTQP